MNTFETAAVISLVDHLTAPLRKMAGEVAGHESNLARSSARMSTMGQHLTYQMSVPILAATKELMDKSLEFSKIENTMRGTLEQRAKSVDKLTMSTKAYAAAQIEAAKAASVAAYNGDTGLPKGMVNVRDHQEAILSAAKSGYTDMSTNDPRASMAPAIAVADTASQLAMATRTDTHTAADDLIALSNAFQVETRDDRGIALGSEELHRKFGHIADVLTSMYTSSNFKDHDEIVASLKLAAPLARFSGLDIGQISAMSAAQKEAGFNGGESSVAQRSFIGAVLAPKSSAYGAVEQIGLNLHDYQKMGADFSAEGYQKQAKQFGYRVAASAAQKAFATFQGGGENGGDFDKLTQTLTEGLKRSGKSKNPISPEVAARFVNKWVTQQAQLTDVGRFIEDVREKGGMNVAQLGQFMEKRQAPRVEPFLTPPASKATRDEFAFENERQYGPNWKMQYGQKREFADKQTPTEYINDNRGIALRQAQEHARGIEGAYKRMDNAIEMMVMKLANNGVFDRLANDVAKLADAFGSADPKVIELAEKAALAAAALGPLVWAIGTIGTLAAAIGKLGSMARGAAVAWTGVEGAAGAAGRALPAVERGFAATTDAAARLGASRALSAVERGFAATSEATARLAAAQAEETAAKRASILATQAVSTAIEKAADDSARAMSRASLEGYATTQRYAAQSQELMARQAQANAEVIAKSVGEAEKFAAQAGEVTMRASTMVEKAGASAEKAAATAVEKLAKVSAFAEQQAGEAAVRAAVATERGMARQELAIARYETGIAQRLTSIGEMVRTEGSKASEAAGKVLGDYAKLYPEIERSAGVAERAVARAADAYANAATVAERLATAQTSETAAKQAAVDAANALANASAKAAKAMSDLAQRQSVAKLAEETASKAAESVATKVSEPMLHSAADVAERMAARAAERQGALKLAEDAAAQMSEPLSHGATDVADRMAARAAERQSVLKLAEDATAQTSEPLLHGASDAAERMAARAAERHGVAKLAEGAAAQTSEPLLHGASDAAERMAERSAQFGKEAGVVAAQAAAEQAAKTARDATINRKVAEDGAAYAAELAQRSATRATLLGMAAKGLGLLSGVGDVAQILSAGIDLSKQRHARDYGLKLQDDNYNPFVNDRVYDQAAQEQARRSTQAFRQDPEAARGQNRMTNDAINGVEAYRAQHDAGPTKIDVNGTVQGKAELLSNVTIEVKPSAYFEGLIKRAEAAANLNLTGTLGHDMAGSNAPTPASTHTMAAGVGSGGIGHH